MPTKHPRHAITETPKLKEILDQLRDETGSVRLDWAELVALGAKEKLRELGKREAARDAILREWSEKIRNGEGDGDVAAADEVKRLGLIERW